MSDLSCPGEHYTPPPAHPTHQIVFWHQTRANLVLCRIPEGGTSNNPLDLALIFLKTPQQSGVSHFSQGVLHWSHPPYGACRRSPRWTSSRWTEGLRLNVCPSNTPVHVEVLRRPSPTRCPSNIRPVSTVYLQNLRQSFQASSAM